MPDLPPGILPHTPTLDKRTRNTTTEDEFLARAFLDAFRGEISIWVPPSATSADVARAVSKKTAVKLTKRLCDAPDDAVMFIHEPTEHKLVICSATELRDYIWPKGDR